MKVNVQDIIHRWTHSFTEMRLLKQKTMKILTCRGLMHREVMKKDQTEEEAGLRAIYCRIKTDMI